VPEPLWEHLHANPPQRTELPRSPNLVPGTYAACIVPVSSFARWLRGRREDDACGAGSLSYL